MSRSQSVAFRLGGALCVVAVAALAAALGHIAIDALGDVLLAHDTYDDIAHDSRTVGAALAACVFLGAGARSVYLALRSRLGYRSARRVFRIESPVRFAALVVALAIPGVLGMEALDAALAGRCVDDAGDLFGGSIVLGLTTTIAVALVVAIAACVLLRFFSSTQALLVRAVAELFQLRGRCGAGAFRRQQRRRASLGIPLVFLRHAAERGPPLLN